MNHQDTVKLLRECDAGTKMGISSIEDVVDRVQDQALRSMLDNSLQEHQSQLQKIQAQLKKHADEGKDPNPIAKGMSWMKTTMKMGMEDSDATIADLMTDGCNMGVKSLNRYLNQYRGADSAAKEIAQDLIDLEHQLTVDIRPYL